MASFKATFNFPALKEKRLEQMEALRKEKRNELIWAKRDPDGFHRSGGQPWQDFLADQKTQRRLEMAGMDHPEKKVPPGLSNFLYEPDDPDVKKPLSYQVKYGPEANLSKEDIGELNTFYGRSGKDTVGKRLTQYETDHNKYVQAAKKSGRELTEQEATVDQTGVNLTGASINHVIASGTGQNTLNHMSRQFQAGGKMIDEKTLKRATVDKESLMMESDKADVDLARKSLMKGFAMQAAAIGKMTGLGRAILKEEAPDIGYGKKLGPEQKKLDGPGQAMEKRNLMAKDVRDAFQAKTPEDRYGGYKSYMAHTFDSFGNLRVGHGTNNTRVSTGLDMPLDSSNQPTQRGLRLFEAYQTHVPENVQEKSQQPTKIRPGTFTTTASGKFLTSSRESK
ncbi:MAG TPA: hypothetical protein VFF03_10860 [Rhodocyclaceae bacterium]|nr:hypothetical protein [Rhodocyclaceae bacterium]